MFKLAPNLDLPADAQTQTFAILAKRGVGKTYTASVLCEELLAHGAQTVVIDPTGAWWGLRSAADGKKPGYPIVIFGGDRGDVPLEPHAGELVATALVDRQFSAILDLSHLRKGQASQLVAAFLEKLYHKNRSALHLVIDEADTFAPQRIFGEDARVCGAVEDVVKKGRLRGFGCTLITQRPQVLNKNVLTQCESLFAMRMTHPRDVDAIKEWVGVHASPEEAKEVIASLPSLPIGEAWFWSPGWLGKLQRIKVRRRTTFDSSATPKAGEVRKAPKSLAEIDLAKLTSEMQASIEAAKASDPKAMKARIAELEKELAKAREAKPPKVERVEVPMLREKELARMEKAVENAKALAEALRDVAIAGVDERLKAAVKLVHPSAPPPKPAPRAAPRPAAQTDVQVLGKAEFAILRAFYWLADEEATKAKVAFYSGYAAGTGSYNNALGRLRTAGMLEGWRITPKGAMELGCSVAEKPTGWELREWLRGKLTRAENSLLDALVKHYPRRLSNEELAEASGYAIGTGGFNNALGKLRTLEAAEGYARDGGTKASSVFFE